MITEQIYIYDKNISYLKFWNCALYTVHIVKKQNQSKKCLSVIIFLHTFLLIIIVCFIYFLFWWFRFCDWQYIFWKSFGFLFAIFLFLLFAWFFRILFEIQRREDFFYPSFLLNLFYNLLTLEVWDKPFFYPLLCLSRIWNIQLTESWRYKSLKV